MHSVLLSAAIGLLVGFGGFALDWWHWIWAILFSLVLTVVAWILIARRVGKKLQPMMLTVQKQLEARMPDAAMQSLRAMLPHGKWMPLLEGDHVSTDFLFELGRWIEWHLPWPALNFGSIA